MIKNKNKIKIIVAYDENRVIGYKGKIPWKISEDLKLFKKITMGNTVVMGRITWDSLPKKPLEGRNNIIISNKLKGNGFFPDLNSALTEADKFNKDIFIIGGQQIYSALIPFADFILASEVNGIHEGDAFFPELKSDEWNKKSIEKYEKFNFVEYEKTKWIL